MGFTGPGSEELARRSSDNLQAVTQASTVLTRGAQEVSQELFGLAQEQSTQTLDRLNRLVICRSVQAFGAARSERMRDNLPLVIGTNWRLAALSVWVAAEAARAFQRQAEGAADHVGAAGCAT